MRNFVFLGMLGLLFSSLNTSVAKADDDQCPDCHPRTKDVCFNLVCQYEFDENSAVEGNRDHRRHCTVASTFTKAVTRQGGEVPDDSVARDNPVLNVSCDGIPIYTNGARRSTDLLGTRIQAQEGPFPAITLPRGELHNGVDDTRGGHYSESTLELGGDDRFPDSARGRCFIWSGYP